MSNSDECKGVVYPTRRALAVECAMFRIWNERERQIASEGWSVEHDDRHTDESLALAAACYAIPTRRRAGKWAELWPWDRKWWKPSATNRIRELEKAGALIVAELERLLRKQETP